ncbi:hypothetical protein EDD22DRAFT_850367 [Suillus occidentalis]|nr:hypothetical protein EDD22DRAFT_850367 [Suillus occidentalis]
MSESSGEHDHHSGPHSLIIPDASGVIPTSAEARSKRHIAALEEELEMAKFERGTKQRKTTYFVSQGCVIRRMVALYISLEDLIAENDRRCEEHWENSTPNQNRLQRGYIAMVQSLLWIHEKLAKLDVNDTDDMLKKMKRGADAARSDDTSTLKDLIAAWVNETSVHDVCGNLLCPAKWDWSKGDLDSVKAGIRNRTSEYIVSENSWPRFVYEGYSVNGSDLEQGLFKSRILVQAFKATFTSPSSAKEADGDGDGATSSKTTGAPGGHLIRSRKVTPRSIAYVVCQVRFALSSVSSWRTVDGDFDYEAFWNNVVDFFEDVPGPVAQRRVDTLLEWWTRKVFGTNHREDLTPEVVSKMSVTALAEQRKALEDTYFDSD